MPSINLRKYNRVALEAELAGKSNYEGPPCKAFSKHVGSAGTTTRDTVRRTCNLCERQKVKAWQERQTERCTST